MVAGHMGVEHPYMEECVPMLPSPEALCLDVQSHAHCLVHWWWRTTESLPLVAVYSSGSVLTLGHTSVRSLAVSSPISLCLKNLNPPCEHVSACSTLNWLPQVHLSGSCSGIHPFAGSLHHKRQSSAGKTHAHLLAGPSASWMLSGQIHHPRKLVRDLIQQVFSLIYSVLSLLLTDCLPALSLPFHCF